MRTLKKGDVVKLIPRSKKGKDIVRDKGDKWEVQEVFGNRILVNVPNALYTTRNVYVVGDQHFRVE